eukprot:1636642-Amphidinium_carterae.1
MPGTPVEPKNARSRGKLMSLTCGNSPPNGFTSGSAVLLSFGTLRLEALMATLAAGLAMDNGSRGKRPLFVPSGTQP